MQNNEGWHGQVCGWLLLGLRNEPLSHSMNVSKRLVDEDLNFTVAPCQRLGSSLRPACQRMERWGAGPVSPGQSLDGSPPSKPQGLSLL